MGYAALMAMYKDQKPEECFARFSFDGRKGEPFWAPYKKLAAMAKPEPWDSRSDKEISYSILRYYLNNTFLRLQQLDFIKYSADGTKACFNTGLQTRNENDIFAVFYKYVKLNNIKNPDWGFHAFVDSYSSLLKDFNGKPEIATYYSDTSDLVFDLSYDIEINYDHILDTNKERLPPELQENRQLALTSIKGEIEFLKERIRRNYKIAIPHWYDDRVQLLLPLRLLDNSKADLALVADKDKSRKIYRIITVLNMKMAYIDARIICCPDQSWLIP